MASFEPLVSVIIPTRNRADALSRALQSLVNQKYKNIEVIVVDDQSSDETPMRTRSFESRLRLTYFRNEGKKGAAYSRNIGLRNAKGEYIALLDDDDEFLEEKIEIQLHTALKLRQEALIVCNGYVDGSPRGYAYHPQASTGWIRWEKTNFLMVKNEIPPPSSWFFPRSVLARVGFFDEAMARWEDIDYGLRIMADYPVYLVNQFLVRWHQSSNSVTGMSLPELKAREYFLRKHFDWIRNDREYLYRFYWRLAKDFEKIGQITEARKYFRKAFVVKPYKVEPLGLCLVLSVRPRFLSGVGSKNAHVTGGE